MPGGRRAPGPDGDELLVLVVDSDPAVTRTLRINLQARHSDVDAAATGAAALKQATDRPPSLIILDLELPDLDGIHVIATLTASSSAPIIVTSARDGHTRGPTRPPRAPPPSS